VPDTIIVDVANVMGSRPDGWWRDRAGAAQRLYASVLELAAAQAQAGAETEYVLVLEGRARAADTPDAPGVSAVRAPGSGDDTIADLARPGTIVVTADRVLRRRCEQAGADVRGPGWLIHQVSLHTLVISPATVRKHSQLELMPMFVVAVVLIVIIAVVLYLLDRALKALRRGRRRRNVAERLYAAEAFAEAREKKRREDQESRDALTSVLPAIIEHGPRKVA
jgi:hypothetical protein